MILGKIGQGSSLEQTVMGWGPQCYIQSFVEIGPLVPEIFKRFYHIWAWQPSWSHHVNKFSFSLYLNAYISNLVKHGPVVSETRGPMVL